MESCFALVHTIFMFPLDLLLFQAFTKPETRLNFQTFPDLVEFVPVTSFFSAAHISTNVKQ